MPPFPPITHDDRPEETAALVRLLATLADGNYGLEVKNDFAPRFTREGSWVFQIGDKVFTIWEDKA